MKIRITRKQLLNTKGKFNPVDLKPLLNEVNKTKLDTFIVRVSSFLSQKEVSDERTEDR
jgi:hypothetical protein